ncbi:MAG: nucleotide pyrophosphatase [Leptolyngbya sp. SIO3F4]|nr:nucleotide pyrophosphatase [Leptolyngbya sp. SIO3F4]
MTALIAIGLDAADPNVLETWMSAGKLPTLARLRQKGCYSRLSNTEHYRAETPWTTFISGQPPEKTGYWGPIKYDPETYSVKEVGAYDYQENPPFYALGEQRKVIAFDIPQSALSEQVNGTHVLGWGAHSPMTASHSTPEKALAQIIAEHGEHPAFLKDFAECRSLHALTRLQRAMSVGIERKANICASLLSEQRWDLFLTIFGETHTAGHYMWHLSQPDHPLYCIAEAGAEDLMLKTFVEVDQAIGKILDASPQPANVVIFSAHGMGANVMDVPSMVFLPELMHRYSFAGKAAIAPGKVGNPLPPVETTFDQKRGWLGEIWNRRVPLNAISRWLRSKMPVRVQKPLDIFLNKLLQPGLLCPSLLEQQGDSLFWQPAKWYEPLWPKMKAFAIPSYSEGYIRINVKGRESNGLVDAEDYETVCAELMDLLQKTTDGRTGQPLVDRVVQMRQDPFDSNPNLPDADLVVLWSETIPSDVMDTTDYGRIGPVPHHRTGSHRAHGFVIADGPDIKGAKFKDNAQAVDLAPTLLGLLGIEDTHHLSGQNLFEHSSVTSVR